MVISEGQQKILKMKKGSVSSYTNTLLRMVYGAEELAKSSLTGKNSNAFKGKAAKAKLRNVDDMIGECFMILYCML